MEARAQGLYERLNQVVDVEIPEQIRTLTQRKKQKTELEKEIDELTTSTYKDGGYRDYLRTSKLRIQQLDEEIKKTEDKKSQEALKGEKDDLEATRESVVDSLTDEEIKNHPTRHGYSSYTSTFWHNMGGLASEFPYAFPLMYDMIWYSTAVAIVEFFGYKDPTSLNIPEMERAISVFSGILTGAVLGANVLGFSAAEEARSVVRTRIDDPENTIVKLMKKHPILAAMMLKHFFDGSYLDVMQLVNPLGFMKYIVAPLTIYFAINYYLPYSSRDILDDKGKLKTFVLWHITKEFAGALRDMFKHLCKGELRAFGADIYKNLVQLTQILQRMVTFAMAGYKEISQSSDFFPIDKPSEAVAMTSASISGVATLAPAYLTRGVAFANRFHNPDLTQEEYQLATVKYDGKTGCEKFERELFRLFLSPSTFVSLSTGFYAYENYSIGATLLASGYTVVGVAFHLMYREAAREEDITGLAVESKKTKKTIPNKRAKGGSLFFSGSDQLSRVGSSVVSVLTLTIGDYYTSGGLRELMMAPSPSRDFLVAVYLLSFIVARGNLPYQMDKIANTLVSISPSFFGNKKQEAKVALLESKSDKGADIEKGEKEEPAKSWTDSICCWRKRRK